MPRHFADRLTEALCEFSTPAVVGIDPVPDRLPRVHRPEGRRLALAVNAVESFARGVIDAVDEHVAAIKINVAFFEAFYGEGLRAYYRTVAYAHRHGLLVIGDIKRGDIGSTAARYAQGHLATPPFDDVDPQCIPDAITLAGYLGENAVRPFVELAAEHGRGVFVLVRPSEPKADEVHEFGAQPRFYEHMAALVRRWGADPKLIGECGLSCVGAVVAAKDAESNAMLRAALPQTPFLIPGYGAQGGTAEDCRPLFRADGTGAVINASRSVIYAFEDEACLVRRGGDWQACIRDACRAFANDVAPLMNMP